MSLLFVGKGLLQKLEIYSDKVVIKKAMREKIVPLDKISDVSNNQLTGKVIFHTSGGDTEFQFFGLSAGKKAKEATNIITKQLNK